MKVTIMVEGVIATPEERITCILSTPDNWEPSHHDYTCVKGAIKELVQRMDGHFRPDDPSNPFD